ncbi:MAG: hypothetical protein IKS96_04960 [Fibrobacter sp.]|nr:hypothetical protein [Fibrobacter sp.]
MRDFKLSFLNNCVFVVASIALCASLFACGGDSGTSSNNEEYVSSSSSSSVIPASSGNRPSSSSKKGDAGSRSTSSGQAPAGMTSSSSSRKIASSSSTPRHDVKQSSSNKALSSSWSEAIGSSNSKQSSSSVILSSSRHSGPDPESSSSFEPFDHFKCLADNWNIRDTIYKQFTDTRNGRSYYYFTAYSSKTGRKVTVMAENLNIGKMVLGSEEQNDDNEIERYCYDNDPAMCDKYGGLYQWAEMMQLPSNCNTESCWMKIRRDHQGICPEGWRLFTWDDFVIVKEFYDKYDDGYAPGLRSQCFVGYNTSGFSLIGGGLRTLEGGFRELLETSYWAYPEEKYPLETDPEKTKLVRTAYVANDDDSSTGISENRSSSKAAGRSVRCVKIE